MAIAGFAVFILGLVFVIIAPVNRKKNARCSAQTKGILKEIRERENSSGSLPNMYVYSYCVNGTEYQTKSTICSPQAKKIGDDCTIWYDPRKPKKAQPFHYETSKVYRIILIIGIAMLLLGIFLMVFGLVQQSR